MNSGGLWQDFFGEPGWEGLSPSLNLSKSSLQGTNSCVIRGTERAAVRMNQPPNSRFREVAPDGRVRELQVDFLMQLGHKTAGQSSLVALLAGIISRS